MPKIKDILAYLLAQFKRGLLTGLFLPLLVIIALAPARLREFEFLQDQQLLIYEFLLSSLARDLHQVMPYAAGYLASLFLLVKALSLVNLRIGNRIVLLLVGAGLLALSFASFFSVEFKIERGSYPSLFDIKSAEGGQAYIYDYLYIITLPRVFIPILLLTMILFWSLGFLKKRKIDCYKTSILALPGFATGYALATMIFFQFWTFGNSLYTTVVDRKMITTPFSNLAAPFGRTHEQIFHGFPGLFAKTSFGTDNLERGFQTFGLKPGPLQSKDCSEHPLAMNLAEKPSPAEQNVFPNTHYATELTRALQALSEALFSDQKKPVHLWHFALESFRSDDIHAINPLAPAEVSPFWNDLYEASSGETPFVIASKKMYQAGVRTSQGLAAIHCGLGTAPFNLSFARDFGNVMFRCLPDVLREGGFNTNQYVGFRPNFDNMEGFFGYHGLKFWNILNFPDRNGHIDKYSHGSKAITDLHLVKTAFAMAQTKFAQNSTYLSMLTINGHGPYWVPKDYPKKERKQIDRFIDEHPELIQQRNDDDRLRVTHYVDTLFGKSFEWVRGSKLINETIPIFIASGDHSISTKFIFSRGQSSPKDLLRRYAGIPFVMFIPPEILTQHPKKLQIYAQIERINLLLSKRSISQNDIPLMILNLLSASNEIRSIPARRRWHNLGGQAMSPYSNAPMEPERTVTWGVDALSNIFGIDTNGEVTFSTKARWISRPEDLGQETILRPGAAVLSSFMRGFQKNCKSSFKIRQTH